MTNEPADQGAIMTMRYLEPTQASGRALVRRRIPGDVVMLNLLRFREVADYSTSPELKPSHAISGADAFQCRAFRTTPPSRV